MEPSGVMSSVPAADRTASPLRVDALDGLRAAMTLLVILHHTAIAYGAIGGWFYRELAPSDSWSSRALVFFCTVNQAFFMGLFFLMAGYFAPGALERKGAWVYVRDRLVRLGLPLLVFGWILGPMTIALAQTQQGRPFSSALGRLWSRGVFEPGPLWFCEALLLFSLAAALWHRFSPASAAPRAIRNGAGPSNLTLLAAALLTGVAAFALRLVWPVGSQWHALQLGYFAGYVVLFVAGCHAAQTGWLEHPPRAQVQLWRRVMWVALPVLPIVALWGARIPSLTGPAEGGWHGLAVVYALWEPLVAWGLILSLLDLFQSRMRRLGPTWRVLAQRAYAMFVIHPPVVVAITIAFHEVPLHALLKFVLTGTTSCVACFVLAGWLLRVPAVRRVL